MGAAEDAGDADGPATSEKWGVCQHDGKEVQLLTLRSAGSAAELRVATYGATLVSLGLPRGAGGGGALDDVLLGFDGLAAYERHGTYLGCAVGRVCSRIAGARFQLDGEEYKLPQNNGEACHHGGPVGFNKYTWDVASSTRNSVTLTHRSPDGDNGFPGALDVTAHYALLPTAVGEGDALLVEFTAEAARPTVVNLTNHLYFNLAGAASNGAADEEVLDHRVVISADAFVPTDDSCIPLEEFRPVDGTPLDFRTPRRIGDRIADESDKQLKIAAGYDHNYVLRDTPGGIRSGPGGTRALGVEPEGGAGGVWRRTREPDALAEHPPSGRAVQCFTEEPCLHFYSGNYLGSEPPGKGGREIPRRGGFCFETQHFTDSPNKPSWPTVVLRPGEAFRTRTVFWFLPRAQ